TCSAVAGDGASATATITSRKPCVAICCGSSTIAADASGSSTGAWSEGPMAAHVPLWCKSHHSFLEGASAPDALIEEAQRLGLRSLALTDRDGVYGIARAHVQARALGVQLLIGAQVTVSEGSHLLLLAQDRRGYAHLCRLLTTGHLRSPKRQSAVTWEEVAT